MPDEIQPELPIEPPATPSPVAPKPEEDLATKVIRKSMEYQARLSAIKQGLFAPNELLNSQWGYFPALSTEDRTFLADNITKNFRELEEKLVQDFTSQIASLIGK